MIRTGMVTLPRKVGDSPGYCRYRMTINDLQVGPEWVTDDVLEWFNDMTKEQIEQLIAVLKEEVG